MGKVINIANKLDREPRYLVLDEAHSYKVDCRKNTVTKLMALSEQLDDQKSEESTKLMEEGLELLIGAKAVKEIDAMDLPFDNWQLIFQAAIAVALNKELEDVSADFRKE